LGLRTQAEAAFKWGMSERPTDLSLRKELVDFFVETDQWEAAENLLAGDSTALMELYSQTWQVDKAERLATNESLQRTLFTLYVTLWEYEKAAQVLWQFAAKQENKGKSLRELVTFCASKGLYGLGERSLQAWGTAKELSDFYISTKQYSKAEKALEMELRKSPQDIDAYQRLAKMHKARGRIEQAGLVLQLGLAVLSEREPCSQRTVTAVKQFLAFCEEQNRYSDYEAQHQAQLLRYRQHLPTSEVTTAWEKDLCDFYKRTKQFRKAETCLFKLTTQPENRQKALSDLAALYAFYGAKQPEKEEEVRLQIRALQPNSLEGEFQLADFYSRWDIKKPEVAEAVLRSLIDHRKQENPTSWELFAALSRLEDLHRKRMEGDKAETVILEALELRKKQDPKSDQTLHILQRLSEHYSSPVRKQLDKCVAVQLEAYRIHLQKLPFSKVVTTLALSVAEGCVQLGRNEAAEELLRELREIWKSAKPIEEGYLDFCKELQGFYQRQKREKAAEEMLLEALETCEKANSGLVDGVLLTLAKYYGSAEVGRQADAERTYQQLVDSRRRQGDTSDKALEGRQSLAAFYEQSQRPGLVETLETIADIQRRRNPRSQVTVEALVKLAQSSEFAKAVQIYRETVRLISLLEPGGSKYVGIVHSLATLYVKNGQGKCAIAALEEACREVGTEQPLSHTYIQAVGLLADTHFATGDSDSALSGMIALASQLRCTAILSPVTIEALTKLASLYERCERWPETAATLQEISLLEERRNPRAETYLASLEKLAEFHCKHREREQAESVLLALLSLCSKQDPYSVVANGCRGKLVALCVSQGRAEAAEQLLIACLSRLPGNKSQFKLLTELAVLSRDQAWPAKRVYWLQRAMQQAEDSNARRSALSELYRCSIGALSEQLQQRLLQSEPFSGRSSQLRSLYI